MSRTLSIAPGAAHITRRALTFTAIVSLSATTVQAQTALGTPFIGQNNLSYQMAELSRSGGADLTRVYGLSYGRRFSRAEAPTEVAMVLRGSARPFDDVNAGVADFAATVGISHEIAAMRGLSVAASVGAEMMAWGDDVASTGRRQLTVPATAGISYDLRLGEATLSPFATASIAHHDLRTFLNSVEQSQESEWDARYSQGVSLRWNRVIVTSTRIVGETGMPNRSRWAFSAGISY